MNITINEGPFGKSVSISDTIPEEAVAVFRDLAALTPSPSATATDRGVAKPGDIIPADLAVKHWPTGIRILHPVGFLRAPQSDLHISPDAGHAWFVDNCKPIDAQGDHLLSSDEMDWERHAWALDADDTIERNATPHQAKAYVVTAVWA